MTEISKTSADLKIINREQVINVYKKGEILSPVEVSERIHLSRQTVSKAIDYFVGKGLLESCGKGDSTSLGGRKPEQYRLSDKLLFLSINMEKHAIIFTLFNLLYEKVDTQTEPFGKNEQPTPDLVWNLLRSTAEQYRAKISLPYRVVGVTLTMRGLVNHDTGILQYSPFFTWWPRSIPVRRILQDIYPEVHCFSIDKPAQLVARSVYMNHEEEFADKRVVVFSQKGIIAGIIDHGKVLNGRNSLIGEFGHMVIDANSDKQCVCGNYGCAVQMILPSTLKELAMKNAGSYPDSPLLSSDYSMPVIFQYSAGGDPLAAIVSEYLGRIFAAVYKNISVSFDPEALVLMGEIGKADQHFMDSFHRELSKFRYYPEEYDLPILFDERSEDEVLFTGSVESISRFYFNDVCAERL